MTMRRTIIIALCSAIIALTILASILVLLLTSDDDSTDTATASDALNGTTNNLPAETGTAVTIVEHARGTDGAGGSSGTNGTSGTSGASGTSGSGSATDSRTSSLSSRQTELTQSTIDARCELRELQTVAPLDFTITNHCDGEWAAVSDVKHGTMVVMYWENGAWVGVTPNGQVDNGGGRDIPCYDTDALAADGAPVASMTRIRTC